MPHWLVVTLWLALADVLLVGFFLVFFRGANLKDDPDEFRRIRSLSWKDYK